MAVPRTVACPTCGTQVEWSPTSSFRPFCSERCKLIDVGAWATESYRIPLAEREDGDPAGDVPPGGEGKPS